MPHSDVSERKSNMQEISFLQKLDNIPFIVQYHNAYRCKDNLWLTMEYINGGTFNQVINYHNLTEPNIAYFSKEILKALNSIHELNIVHRDIKPANIMINFYSEIKLIDFGLSIDISLNKSPNNMVGSAFWMSPEMIKMKPHSTACDIWSFGIILYEILIGKKISKQIKSFRAMFENAVLGGPNLKNKVKNNKNSDDLIFGNFQIQKELWSDDFLNFIQECLNPDPDLRPTAKKILSHPFLNIASKKHEMYSVVSSMLILETMEKETNKK